MRVATSLFELCKGHQLGVHKAGFEIGVHSMCHAIELCEQRPGHAILLVDMKNAFNRADRALMLKLIETHIPETANLAYFIYECEPTLYTDRADFQLVSSEGGQQGCSLVNTLFALLMLYCMTRIKRKFPKLWMELAFWDDEGFGGPIAVLGALLAFLDELTPTTGCVVGHKKTHLLTGSAARAQLAREMVVEGAPLFPPEVNIHADYDGE